MDLLPRRCPVCRDDTIIGHGRRLRQGHDDRHACLWVRRGICQPCSKTFTILPDWLAPSGHYSLQCRQQSCEQIAAGDSLEQAAPHCKDPTRLPDPSTLRRWAQRRLLTVWCWVRAGAQGEHFLRAPTILAWDLSSIPLQARARSLQRRPNSMRATIRWLFCFGNSSVDGLDFSLRRVPSGTMPESQKLFRWYTGFESMESPPCHHHC